MGNTRKARYSEATLRAVQRAWQGYKSETGASQDDAAKALGMYQTALSQYLRGKIPLNTDFLTKFSKLTNTPLSELGVISTVVENEPRAATVQVKYTLSGAKAPSQKVLVTTVVPSDKCFGVLIDVPDHPMGEGTIALVYPDDEVRSGDTALIVNGQSTALVTMKKDRNGWRAITPSWGGYQTHDLKKSTKVHRVTGLYYPPREGAVYGA